MVVRALDESLGEDGAALGLHTILDVTAAPTEVVVPECARDWG
jgi:hypothetical protein